MEIKKFEKQDIILREIPKWGPYLRGQWESFFANHLSKEKKKRFIKRLFS